MSESQRTSSTNRPMAIFGQPKSNNAANSSGQNQLSHSPSANGGVKGGPISQISKVRNLIYQGQDKGEKLFNSTLGLHSPPASYGTVTVGFGKVTGKALHSHDCAM